MQLDAFTDLIAAITSRIATRPLDSTLQNDLNLAVPPHGSRCVYGPSSAHAPTVTSGRALVLYLLPEGQIEFTKS